MITKKQLNKLGDDLKKRGGELSNIELDILRKSFFFKTKLLTISREVEQIKKYEFDPILRVEQLGVLLGQVVIINTLFNNVLSNIEVRQDSSKLIKTIERIIEETKEANKNDKIIKTTITGDKITPNNSKIETI